MKGHYCWYCDNVLMLGRSLCWECLRLMLVSFAGGVGTALAAWWLP